MYYYEMLCQVPLTVAEKKESVLCVGNENEIKKELSKHNLEAKFVDVESAKSDINTTEPKYDVIISETPLYELDLSRALTEKGIYVTKIDGLVDVEMMKRLGEHFYIVMPYFYFDEDLKIHSLLFASKKLHPVSDVSRHIADFLEGNEYYNVDIHEGAFNYPNFIFEQIKDALKI